MTTTPDDQPPPGDIAVDPAPAKTAWLRGAVIEHCGAALVTSTKSTDLDEYIAALRARVARSGDVEMFNPEGLTSDPPPISAFAARRLEELRQRSPWTFAQLMTYSRYRTNGGGAAQDGDNYLEEAYQVFFVDPQPSEKAASAAEAEAIAEDQRRSAARTHARQRLHRLDRAGSWYLASYIVPLLIASVAGLALELEHDVSIAVGAAAVVVALAATAVQARRLHDGSRATNPGSSNAGATTIDDQERP